MSIKTHEVDIQNTTTLAPLKEDLYNPQFLKQKDGTILSSISKNLINNIDLTLGSLLSLIEHLKIYKEIAIDSINAEAESIDLATKYESNPPQQVHSLPGITSIPPAYDLQAIKKDNERMMSIKDIRDKVGQQKDLYIKVMNQEYRLVSMYLKKVLYNDSTLDTFIASLNQKTGNQ